MDEPFKLLIRVRYGECDAQQVVFNARYADYADLANTELMREMIGGYQQLIAQNLDTQVVNLNISWKGSAKFDDVLRLESTVTRVGNTSFVISVDMFIHDDDKHIATAEVVYVLVSTKDFQKTPISESLKQQLLAGASGKIVDMAGGF